jgi:serine/threonine protein kinase
LRVTAQDWQTLSPLVDVAMDIAVSERRKWVESLTHLTSELREKLFQLVAQHGAPETQQFLETLPSLETLLPPRDALTDGDWRTDDVIGSYTLIRAIGHGGMGDVWLAKRSDGAYQRSVALKLPSPDAAPARIRERMLRERDVLASLEHANIARFYDAGVTASGQPFIAMEYIEGFTLSEYAESKKLSVRERCKLFLQVLSAVQFAHQRLVVHRDLKPSNIQVRNDGQVALLDFGIAKVLDETSHLGTESQLTRDTGRALTVAYAAPEQVLSEPISTATDIFSAGALFYELLSGGRPFAAHEKNMAAMIKAYDAPIKAMPSTLGRDLNAIVCRALRREPNDRYESAAAFADDIKRYLDDQPVVAVQGARWYSFSKFVKRQRVVISVGTLGLIAISALGINTLIAREKAHDSAIAAKTVDTLLTGLLSGMSPESSEDRLFSAKELMDQSLRSFANETLQPSVALRYSDVYRMIGEPQSAVGLIDKALPIAQASNDTNAVVRLHAYKALSQLESSDNDKAAQTVAQTRRLPALKKADDLTHGILDVVDGQVAFFEGKLVAAAGSFGEARARFERIGKNPEDYLTYVIGQQSAVASQQGKLNLALQLLREAQAAATKYGERGSVARMLRLRYESELHAELADPASAINASRQLYTDMQKRLKPGHPELLRASIGFTFALLAGGEIETAKSVFTQISPSQIGVHADIARDYRLISLSLLATTEPDTATKHYEALAATNVNKATSEISAVEHAVVLQALGELLVTRQRPTEALTWLRRATNAVQDKPYEHVLMVNIHLTKAVAHLQLQDFTSAKDALARIRNTYLSNVDEHSIRVKTIDFYDALATVGLAAKGKVHGAFSAQIRDRYERLSAAYSAPKRLAPLSLWAADFARSNATRWEQLPPFVP